MTTQAEWRRKIFNVVDVVAPILIFSVAALVFIAIVAGAVSGTNEDRRERAAALQQAETLADKCMNDTTHNAAECIRLCGPNATLWKERRAQDHCRKRVQELYLEGHTQ